MSSKHIQVYSIIDMEVYLKREVPKQLIAGESDVLFFHARTPADYIMPFAFQETKMRYNIWTAFHPDFFHGFEKKDHNGTINMFSSYQQIMKTASYPSGFVLTENKYERYPLGREKNLPKPTKDDTRAKTFFEHVRKYDMQVARYITGKRTNPIVGSFIELIS